MSWTRRPTPRPTKPTDPTAPAPDSPGSYRKCNDMSKEWVDCATNSPWFPILIVMAILHSCIGISCAYCGPSSVTSEAVTPCCSDYERKELACKCTWSRAHNRPLLVAPPLPHVSPYLHPPGLLPTRPNPSLPTSTFSSFVLVQLALHLPGLCNLNLRVR